MVSCCDLMHLRLLLAWQKTEPGWYTEQIVKRKALCQVSELTARRCAHVNVSHIASEAPHTGVTTARRCAHVKANHRVSKAPHIDVTRLSSELGISKL